MKVRPPLATISIITFATALYLLNSGGDPYIYPITKLAYYGVSVGNQIVGGILYSFTHIGLKHLMANMFILAIIGSILEQRLESKHVFAIFILSGWLAGTIYTWIKPDVWVLGASAAICGLIAAGFVVDVKKTVLGLVLGLYMIPIVVYPTADFIIHTTYQAQENVIQESTQKIMEYAQQLKNASEEEKPVIIQKINQTYTLVKKAEKEQTKLVKGVETEAVTPTSHIIHFLGGSIALIYLALFDRRAFRYLWEDVNGIIKLGSSLVGGRIKERRR